MIQDPQIVPIEASKKHCAFVFDILIASINKTKLPQWPQNLPSDITPLFVSYYKGKNKNLRGCIGTFAKEQLKVLLPKYALVAANEDNRFKPITALEINELSVEVSLLTKFEKI